MLKLNEVLKASKGLYVNDGFAMLWGKQRGGWKTITGVLPLTFTAKGGTAADWVIDGNDDNGTENLFDGTIESGSWSGTVGNVPTQYGTDIRLRSNNMFSLPSTDTYTLAVFPSDYKIAVIRCNSDGEVISNSGWSTNNYHTLTSFEKCVFIIKNADNTTISPSDIEGVCIVKGSTAPDHYIPYQQGVGEQRVDGYYVPLTISQAGQTDKSVDIYIGDSPLTEGETVSKTSTGQNIELFEGENTVSTTLYNKPEMEIKYKE